MSRTKEKEKSKSLRSWQKNTTLSKATIRRTGRCSNNTFFNIEEKKKHRNHYHNNKSDKQLMLEGKARTCFYSSTVPPNHNRSWLYKWGQIERWRRKSWFILKVIQRSNKLYIDALRFSSQRLHFFVSCSFLMSHWACVLKTSFESLSSFAYCWGD